MAIIILKAKTGLSFKLKRNSGKFDIVKLKPDGVINNIEDNKLEALKENNFFKRAVEKGFIVISNSKEKVDEEKNKAEINKAEKKRQDEMSNKTKPGNVREP